MQNEYAAKPRLKVAIIGATGSLGRALAETEANAGHDLYLTATDQRDLADLKADLNIRYRIQIEVACIDFTKESEARSLSKHADRYYFPIGFSTNDDTWGSDPNENQKLFQINAGSVAVAISHIISNKGSRSIDIVGFGSIAETRGRERNVVYSMAKRALTSYFESLLHACERENIRPFLFQMGYLDSQQSLGKKLLFPIADPKKAASAIQKYVVTNRPGIRYYPKFWFYICLILRCLPWSLYRRIRF